VCFGYAPALGGKPNNCENTVSDTSHSEFDRLTEHLNEAQRLLSRHRLVENLVNRQEKPNHKLVESIVHR
jgi:DNA-binding response OmpR family regulator